MVGDGLLLQMHKKVQQNCYVAQMHKEVQQDCCVLQSQLRLGTQHQPQLQMGRKLLPAKVIYH